MPSGLRFPHAFLSCKEVRLVTSPPCLLRKNGMPAMRMLPGYKGKRVRVSYESNLYLVKHLWVRYNIFVESDCRISKIGFLLTYRPV